MNSSLHPVSPNRRRRVRHKIQTPAYVSFIERISGAMLDLHEIVDISEDGVAIQCHSPLEVKTRVNLCLDLADCAEHIYTTGQVIWSNASGRAGLHFSEFPPESLSRLREWLFVNVMAGVANGETQLAALPEPRCSSAPQLQRYAGGRHRRATPGGGSGFRSCRGSAIESRNARKLWFAPRVLPSRWRTPIRISWFVAPVPVRMLLPSAHACRSDPVFPGNA